MGKKTVTYFCILISGILFLCSGIFPAFSGESSAETSASRIVTVDISYSLFMALASYQELTETEKNGKNINREMLPVLKSIIEHLRSERQKIEKLSPSGKINVRLGQILLRTDRHIDGFSKELLYRKKVAEYESLMEEQRRIIEEK